MALHQYYDLIITSETTGEPVPYNEAYCVGTSIKGTSALNHYEFTENIFLERVGTSSANIQPYPIYLYAHAMGDARLLKKGYGYYNGYEQRGESAPSQKTEQSASNLARFWGSADYEHRFATNIPVLVTDNTPTDSNTRQTIENLVFQYSQTGDWSKIEEVLSYGFYILNLPEGLDPNRKQFYIYNKYANATASFTGLDFGSNTVYSRFLDFEVSENAVLYEPSPFEMNIITKGQVIGSVFSDIGRESDSSVVTEGSLYYSGPFYDVWDNTTTGNITVSQNFLQTNMLIFSNMQDIEDYFNGIADAETKAKNYDDIATNGGTSAVNKTGTAEESTLFGTPRHKDKLIRRYILTESQLDHLSNTIFNQTALEEIADSLIYWGNKPIDYVCDLTFYPFDVSNVVQYNAEGTIMFGSAQVSFDVLGYGNVKKIVSYNGYKDMGTFTLYPTFNSWRDVEPYQTLYCYLPYIGTYSLSLKRYLNKTINVRYYFDFNTRSCCACLIADGKLMDYFTGQIGITCPTSAVNYSEYANTQIQTLLNTGKNAVVMGAISGSTGVGGAILNGGFELASNMRRGGEVNTMGSSSATINEFLPQYVYFIFDVADVDEPTNLLTLKGKPSNASGRISNFTGFLQVDSVELNCSRATDNEKAEILQALKTGIYI